MPDLNFVLPHWLYWSGLVVFPLIAMRMARRQLKSGLRPSVSLPIGYLLLITAGFIGIHRFYVKNWRGVLFLPLFFGILLSNGEGRQAREDVSLADSDVAVAEFDVEMAVEDVEADPEDAEAAARLVKATAESEAARARFTTARAGQDRWSSAARYLAITIAVLLLFDAIRLPRLVQHCKDREGQQSSDETLPEPLSSPAAELPAALARVVSVLDRTSLYSGEFVSYWAVIAVFAYYYEVLARYIFNSPTNWVHEGMFLMFGMMYLLSGAYAFMTDSHVRVDIFYTRLSRRRKALSDLLTSVFFFIFAGTLLVTGWTFLMDSFEVREVSFTEWAIQYWPVKSTLVIGAVLILLQGIARTLTDLSIVFSRAK